MTKKMLWYVFLGLLCCGLGAMALNANIGATGRSGDVANGLKATVRGAGATWGQSPAVTNQPDDLAERRVEAAARAAKFDGSALEAEIAALEAQIFSTAAFEQDVPMAVKLRLNELYALRPENQADRRNLDQGNDVCPGVVIAAVPYTDSGTTAGYVNNYTATCGGSAGSADVVYEFTPATTGSYNVSLCGSSFDTVIHIKTGGACPGTTQVACNDDFCGLQSQVSVVLTAGTTYYVFVDGYSTGSSGAYTLNITGGVECIITCQGGDVVEPAENPADTTFYRTDPTGGCNSTPTPFFGALTCGQTACGLGFTYTGPGGAAYRDTDWWQFTIADPCTVRWSVRAEFPLLIGLVTGVSPCTAPAFLTSATNANLCSTTTVQVICLAPGTYAAFVAPNAFDGITTPAEYRGTLTCSAPCAPCVPDFTLTAPGTVSGNTVGAGDNCSANAGEEQVVQITIPNDGEWSFSLCGGATWDTWLDLATQCCGTPFISVDDFCGLQSEIERAPLTAGTYYLAVEGFGTATGAWTLNVTQCIPCSVSCAGGALPEAETCDPSVPDVINGGCNSIPPVTLPIANGQTYCGNTAANDTIRDTDWYAVTIPANTDITITIQAERDVLYGLVDTSAGCASASFVTSAVAEGCSLATLSATCFPAGTYFVFVAPSTFPTPCADYNVSVTLTPRPAGPVNDDCVNAIDAGTTGANNINFTHNGDNTNACEECADLSGGVYGDVWYKFTLTEPCSVTVDLCGTASVFSNAYIVFTTACPCDPAFTFADSWDFTACGDGNITLYWPVLPAGTYYYPVLREAGVVEGPFTIHIESYCVQCDPIFDLAALPYNHRFNANPSNPPDSLQLTWSVPDTAMVDSVIVYYADGAYPAVDPPAAPWTVLTTAVGTPVPGNASLRYWVDSSPLSVLPGTPSVPKVRHYDVTRFYCYIAPPPPPPQAAEQCPGTALTGSLPIVVSNTTVGLTSNYSCVGLGATAPASCWSPGGGTYYSETSSCAGPDAAYDWTAPATGTYTFSLAGSAYDTGLLLYNYTCPTEPVNPTDYICGSDDSAADLTSYIGSVSLSAGQRILIIVDGFSTGAGAYTLTISTP